MHRTIAFLICVVLAAGGCASGEPARTTPGRLRLATTVSPITNIVSNVTGRFAQVVGIVPEGENSHEFDPAPSVVRTLARADIVFINGLHLEEPTRELAEANLAQGAEIVALGDRTVRPAEYIYDFSFPREQGDPNPHLWTNPRYGKRFAEIVRDEAVRRDPGHAAAFRRNFAAFAEKVDALDAALRTATATVPPERRKLITYHDSFPYFAREYGWTVIGAVQPSDFSEPTPREVAGLIRQVREAGVPAIFGSEVFPSPILERIAAESGARYIDELRDDDLPGKPGEPEHTYLGLLRFDYVTIVEALGGDASALKALDVRNVTRDMAEYPQ